MIIKLIGKFENIELSQMLKRLLIKRKVSLGIRCSIFDVINTACQKITQCQTPKAFPHILETSQVITCQHQSLILKFLYSAKNKPKKETMNICFNWKRKIKIIILNIIQLFA